MPGLFPTEVLDWHPMSALTKNAKHLDSVLLTVMMRTKDPHLKYYCVVPAVLASGELRLLEKGQNLRKASEVYDVLCSWCKMPMGVDLSGEDKASTIRSPLKPKPTFTRRS